MSDVNAYIGEIRYFGGVYAPRDWMFCAGQILSIADFSALFALIGTQYGGDGRTNFVLPDMRGRVPVGSGNGTGLTPRYIGQKIGTEKHSLTTSNLPSHGHAVTSYAPSVTRLAYNVQGDITEPAAGSRLANKYFVGENIDLKGYHPNDGSANPGKLNVTALSTEIDSGDTGSSSVAPIDNHMPFLVLNPIICTRGVFPPRS